MTDKEIMDKVLKDLDGFDGTFAAVLPFMSNGSTPLSSLDMKTIEVVGNIDENKNPFDYTWWELQINYE